LRRLGAALAGALGPRVTPAHDRHGGGGGGGAGRPPGRAAGARGDPGGLAALSGAGRTAGRAGAEGASRPQALAPAGGLLLAQSTIAPEPTTTSPSSSTRMGTLRWPLSLSTSARSRPRLGHVQNFRVPPLTFSHS